MSNGMTPDAFVFVHWGLPSYLFLSLWQAHVASPKIKLILVGDVNPRLSFVQWIDIQSLSSSWEEMARVYVHLSTNSEDFERRCFYRWFAVREVMSSLGLERIIHLDSDVLVFFDPAREQVELDGCELAIGSTSSYSGHFAFINSPSAIDEICRVMVYLFKTEQTLEELRNHFIRQGPLGGGVCDMYALGWLVWNQIMKVKELNVIRNQSVFDQSLRDERMYGNRRIWRMRDGKKLISWNSGHPYFETIEGESVRARTIHFQGDCKSSMLRYVNELGPYILFRFSQARLRESVEKTLAISSSWLRHCFRGMVKRWRRIFG